MTANHPQVFDVKPPLKSRFSFISLMAGPYVTFVNDCVKDTAIDALCSGAGEGAIVELFDALRDGREWRGIQDLAWCEDGETLHKDPLRPRVKDLDALGFPDRSVLYGAENSQ
jgi:radical SAM superfamily enzyme YgiQ (UPF0313 family)